MKTAPLRILIVDDHADTARMLKVLLKREGHDAWMAGDGPAAIEAAKVLRPDVVLQDLRLPGMSGVDVAMALRSNPELSGCVLVAMSGYGAERLPCPSPFDHHFSKPIPYDALLNYLSGLQARPKPPGGARGLCAVSRS